MSEQDLEKLESTANILRGMAMDPRIPEEARRILVEEADVLDRIVSSTLEEGK